MKQIGVIGVGYIGKLFVDRLLDAEYPVTVFDSDEEQVAYATDRGATAATNPVEIGKETDIILMALPGSAEVEEIMQGDEGLLSELSGGQLVIDVTTTRRETSVECDQWCQKRGAQFIEAPITGAAPREGYHMMIGGTEENYRNATEILNVLCDDHVRIGEVGTATVFKLTLQMRYAGHHALDAEIVEFARDNGVDPALLNEFLDMGIWENYLSGDFSQDIEGLGGLAIWHKDIGYARAIARENGTALPLNAVVYEAYKATVRQTGPDEGHASSLIKYWQTLNDANNRYD